MWREHSAATKLLASCCFWLSHKPVLRDRKQLSRGHVTIHRHAEESQIIFWMSRSTQKSILKIRLNLNPKCTFYCRWQLSEFSLVSFNISQWFDIGQKSKHRQEAWRKYFMRSGDSEQRLYVWVRFVETGKFHFLFLWRKIWVIGATSYYLLVFYRR